MNSSRLKALIALVLMVAAFAGAAAWRPTAYLADSRPKVDLETMFPEKFADWRVDDRMPVQLIAPDQAAVLTKIYNQTLSRTYVNTKGERVMLSVAYGGDQSDATRAHRPEVCYPAQGFQVLSSSQTNIAVGQQPLRVRQLVAKMGARIEPITYWVMVGDNVTVSGTEQKLAQLSYSTRGLIPDGMLIRVSSIDPNPRAAYALQEAFVSDLAEGVSADVRSKIVGGA